MSNVEDTSQPIDLLDVLRDPSVTKLYVNGLTLGISLSDVFMIVNSGPVPVAVIQMSLTTAKTMMVSLVETIRNFEEQTGQPLLTMQDINERCFGGKK